MPEEYLVWLYYRVFREPISEEKTGAVGQLPNLSQNFQVLLNSLEAIYPRAFSKSNEGHGMGEVVWKRNL